MRPMLYVVSEETKNQTVCRKGFGCLSGNMREVCRISNALGTRLIVTDCPQRGTLCDYCKAFELSRGFCICPTRLELHNRYHV